MNTSSSRSLIIVGSVFTIGWGVLHGFVPYLADFDQQLQPLLALTVDYILLISFFTSLCLVAFGSLGVMVATRFWQNAPAVKLILWPMASLCVIYAGYMLVRPLRLSGLPVPTPILHAMYVIGPLLLALCYVIPLLRLRARSDDLYAARMDQSARSA